jgi:peptidoglycan hydrolase CwlO-like protein
VADCHKLLGETAKANEIYQQLAASDSSYRARAVNELASRGQAATAGKSAAAAPKRQAAPRKPAPAAPPQQKQNDAFEAPAQAY